MTPEGEGVIENVWRPGDSGGMYDERTNAIPDEPCLAVRYRSSSWRWFLLSECSIA